MMPIRRIVIRKTIRIAGNKVDNCRGWLFLPENQGETKMIFVDKSMGNGVKIFPLQLVIHEESLPLPARIENEFKNTNRSVRADRLKININHG